MPGSLAETVYGRQGGGWLPKETKPRSDAQPVADRDCRTCGLAVSAHTRTLCRSCSAPIEHHTAEYAAECWAGRARMADAKRHAGGHLNDVDIEALRRAGT